MQRPYEAPTLTPNGDIVAATKSKGVPPGDGHIGLGFTTGGVGFNL